MDAVTLYQRHTIEELTRMADEIRADPANQIPRTSGTIHLYTPKARRKLDRIAWAIRYHLADRKEG